MSRYDKRDIPGTFSEVDQCSTYTQPCYRIGRFCYHQLRAALRRSQTTYAGVFCLWSCGILRRAWRPTHFKPLNYFIKLPLLHITISPHYYDNTNPADWLKSSTSVSHQECNQCLSNLEITFKWSALKRVTEKPVCITRHISERKQRYYFRHANLMFSLFL